MRKIKVIATACPRSQHEILENCSLKAFTSRNTFARALAERNNIVSTERVILNFALSCEKEEAKNQHQIQEKIARARYLIDRKIRLLQKIADIDSEILLLLRSE